MKKNLILLLVIAALVVLGVWYWGSAKKESAQLPADSTTAISQDLAGVDLGDFEGEFKDVEAALGTL